MARICIIKVFTGLNLAPAQLSAELQANGHETQIVYFKDFANKEENEIGDFIAPANAGWMTISGRERRAWSTYAPFQEVEFEALFRVLKQFKPDVICMSVYSAIIHECGSVAKRIKEHFPDKPMVWGGPGPTLTPDECIQYADILCINEGEEFIVELAAKVDADEDLSSIEGGWFKGGDGTITKTGQRPLLDIKTLQAPDWEESRYVHIKGKRITRNSYPWNLMATKMYGTMFSGKQYVLMTQRGCPFSCSFCIESRYQEMFGKKKSLRRRTVDQVMDELLFAKNVMGVVSIWFYDDVFTVNPSWLREFLPRYKEEIGLPFWCYTYPTTHTPEILRLLKDAGCDSVTMGVQSGSERLLKEVYNRPTKIDRVLEAADEIVAAGLVGTVDLLTKSEYETVDDLENTFQFMLALNRKLHCWAFSEVTSYETYDYTTNKSKIGLDILLQTMPSQNDYDFYHKLYRLTRTEVPLQQLADFPRDATSRMERQADLDDMLDEWYLKIGPAHGRVDDKNNARLDGGEAQRDGHLDIKSDDHRIKGVTY